MNLHELFKLGMDRDIAYPYNIGSPHEHDRYILNLGAGTKQIPNAISMDLPDWDADCMPIPFEDETVIGIHAYHFLEHVDDPIAILKECERVLHVGGVMNIVVPYYRSQLAFQEITHKHYFTEDTWRSIFDNPMYPKGEWQFMVRTNVIMGVVERNLALVTQLVKVA